MKNYQKMKFCFYLLVTSLLLNGCATHSGGTGSRRQALEQLKVSKKFEADKAVMYPGAATEVDRSRLDNSINALIDKLLAADVESLDKQAVLKEFKIALDHFEVTDSEDEDQVCRYLEKIMDIFQIESSDGVLNTWRYGFDPNKPAH